ncbi:MAG: amino acid adenylation domain-containing protein [Erysipelotrichaceae bacterium]|nr:amino acid adenylation domain-containing protein [Erysipelotrichaceae bacterium]
MKNVLEYLENSAYDSNKGVIEGSSKISYMDIMINSKKMASFLYGKTKMRKPIPVFMDKGVQCLCSFFSVLYLGCFYVLINPDLPIDRINNILSTLNSSLVITNDKYKDKALSIFKNLEVYAIEEMINFDIHENKLSELRIKMIDTDPMYANFTSGSTGVPKGVLVSHRSVIDFIDVFTKQFNITSNDRIANQAPFDFDVSVKDIYSAIKMNADLIIVPKELFSIPSKLLDYLCEHKPTVLIWAVSALCLITTFHGLDYKTPTSINKILFSGEVMPYKHLAQWISHLPDAIFVNLYGPTEITCNCTYHIIDKTREYTNGLPIGKSFDNEEIILLDDNDNLIEHDNVTGEICVRGTALALGYYNNKEETTKRFVQNPTNDSYIDLIYRTGDLGYFFNDELFFAGRKDFQIKYLGHRIELEEVENLICNIDGISRCICSFDYERKKLYAFYMGTLDKKALHEKIKEKLPIYMIPSKLVQVENYPLNKNGKVDRKELYKLLGGK